MQSFMQVMTAQKNQIEQILISDLHLPIYKPVSKHLEQVFLAQAFLDFLDKCLTLPKLQKLYVLGDWFEVWLGDDIADTPAVKIWLTPMLQKLDQLTQNKVAILVMTGNRDFLLGQKFCDSFGGKLIQQPYYFHLSHKTIRLEHGDALCTADKKYQYFRKVIQHPLTKKLLLVQSLKKREQIANNLRAKSQQNNGKKSMQIMDVNPQAVATALKDCDILIHGHTHRPHFFVLADNKYRAVLGDWRIMPNKKIAQVEAVIGIIGLRSNKEDEKLDLPIELVKFSYMEDSHS